METLKKVLTFIGSILAVIGAFFLLKKNDAPAKVQEIETKIKENEAAIKSEEAKREEIVKTAEEEKKKDVTGQDLADLLTRELNKPK